MKYTTTDGLITVNAPEPPDWSLESIAGASQGESGEGQQHEVARQLGMLASWMDTASFATLSSLRR